MSRITDMVIYTGTEETEAMARLNAWCAANDPCEQQFGALDGDAAGGRKFFTGQVWAMAGNYFPHEDLIKVFPTFGWEYPEGVVLIVDYEQDDATRIYRADGPIVGIQGAGLYVAEEKT